MRRDYCLQCRGVWLDRGELDKIIERSAPADAAPATAPTPTPRAAPAPQHQYQQRHDQPWGEGDRHGSAHARGHKKPKHWLSEIFD